MTKPDKRTRDLIKADIVVSVVPPGGYEAQPQGRADVIDAIRMGKHLIIWYKAGANRDHFQPPIQATAYEKTRIVRGSKYKLRAAVYEITNGDPVDTTFGEYQAQCDWGCEYEKCDQTVKHELAWTDNGDLVCILSCKVHNEINRFIIEDDHIIECHYTRRGRLVDWYGRP